jgi:hypothetical protein
LIRSLSLLRLHRFQVGEDRREVGGRELGEQAFGHHAQVALASGSDVALPQRDRRADCVSDLNFVRGVPGDEAVDGFAFLVLEPLGLEALGDLGVWF